MTIGKSLYKFDALGKVTGETLFPADISYENMLHGAVLFSAQPHARMLSMNLEAAFAVEGVVMILTAKDVPNNEYGLTMFDQPVIVGLDNPKPHCDISRWEADHVAFVVAETAEAALIAREKIEIEWEPLPLVNDVFEALTDEVIVHPEKGSNCYEHYKIRKGEMDKAWESADIVIEGRYEVPYQEHAYLQPEAGLGYIDENGRITVELAGQWTHADQEQVAHALAIPPEQIRIVYPAIGGAFGGREDMSIQILLALAAQKLAAIGIHRPVRTIWTREESIIGHHKRHQAVVETKWGATKAGKIVAVEADVYLDAGAYNYTSNKVLGNFHLTVGGPYEIPNARIDSYALYTTNVPGGAFRGFGAPQGCFAAETQMNKLAAALEMDPIELRLKNALREESISIVQTPMPPAVSLPEVIARCGQEMQQQNGNGNRNGNENGNGNGNKNGSARSLKAFRSLPPAANAIRRGRGVACAYKNIGFSFGFPERCEATIDLYGGADIERVILSHAGADVGQGAHTVFRQMAAQALNVPLDIIEVRFSDTATSGDSGSASASRMTWMAGNAIIQAAEKALQEWKDEERPAQGHVRFSPRKTTPMDPATGKSDPNLTYGYVAEGVELTVDTQTGHINVERVVCVNDVGKAINPNLIEGQIEGAVIQAHGYAITENLQIKNGHILNPRLSTYLMPGISDIPKKVDSVIMEIPDPQGPWGVRGMAEMPLIPLAPAITAALHDATGVWFDQIPLTPPRVLAKLRAANGIA
ncbi:MAG: xanthine dehydrogenase family protein molybdopterin-binding subunit [Ardenticatenaceae bacterium]